VAQLAAEYGLSAASLGSDGVTNLKGERKARALVAAYGEGGFDYAGNGPEDVAVWHWARRALVVGRPRGAEALLAGRGGVLRLPGGWKPAALLRALRPHQWVKNVLLLLPLLAAHEFGLTALIPVLWGIAAFSAAASSIYVVNDLLDLEADRLHPTKRRRPFASGAVPIAAGMAAALGLGLFALAVAAALNAKFLAAIALYMALSLAYSLRLKRLRWIDVTTLAALYTLRVIAGAAAAEVEASIYMLIFVFPVFLTLGCVKRLTELAKARDDARLPGRGYGRGDRGDLLNVAWIGVVGALTIFFLYSLSDQGRALYPTTWILWTALVPMFVWLARMVRLGREGLMDYDPVVFALRDKAGLGLLCFTLSLMFWAAGLWAQWFGL
jgi:4-hydroxybenzoate polyprenyltransferase